MGAPPSFPRRREPRRKQSSIGVKGSPAHPEPVEGFPLLQTVIPAQAGIQGLKAQCQHPLMFLRGPRRRQKLPRRPVIPLSPAPDGRQQVDVPEGALPKLLQQLQRYRHAGTPASNSLWTLAGTDPKDMLPNSSICRPQ